MRLPWPGNVRQLRNVLRFAWRCRRRGAISASMIFQQWTVEPAAGGGATARRTASPQLARPGMPVDGGRAGATRKDNGWKGACSVTNGA